MAAQTPQDAGFGVLDHDPLAEADRETNSPPLRKLPVPAGAIARCVRMLL